ncbi:hypothetical protein GEV33_007782 [Tenebrio molitor]|uniref:Uncharacterized protein n=1 Tax=Tenebrio molitor TaxID=7067 RepID=A0A8J6HHV2_TENMO|nr:hypothetical protein GEV33_007782 [Tenebrio molitor]
MKNTPFFALLTLANLCFGAKLPTTFKKCDKKQSDFDQCLSTAVKDALSQLNVGKKEELGQDPLVSLKITKMSNFLDLANSLKANRMDFEKKTLELDVDYPEIIMNFEYQISGKILVLPIQGEGPGRMTLIKPRILLTLYLEEYEKKNKKYYKVVKNTLLIEPQGLHYKLDNLFNGDKALGDNINQVLNDNGKEVYADVKTSYEEAFGKIFATVSDNLLTRVPVAELFSEK